VRRKHNLLSYRLSAVLLNISDTFERASAMYCVNFDVCKIKFIGSWVSDHSWGLRGTRYLFWRQIRSVITQRNTIIFENLTVFQQTPALFWVLRFNAMRCSEGPATGPSTEPHYPIQRPHNPMFLFKSILPSDSNLGLPSSCTRSPFVDSSWNVMAHGDAREGKWRGN